MGMVPWLRVKDICMKERLCCAQLSFQGNMVDNDTCESDDIWLVLSFPKCFRRPSPTWPTEACTCRKYVNLSLLFRAVLFSQAVSLCSCHVSFEWMTVAFNIVHFESSPKWCTYSAVWLLHGWCHVKLLPSQCTFCVHHRTMHQFTMSLHLKPHT